MAFSKKTTGEKSIIVPALKIETMSFWVRGNAPFVSHSWSQKALQMMAAAQSGEPKQGSKKEGRKPFEDYMDSIYYTDEPTKTVFTDPDGKT